MTREEAILNLMLMNNTAMRVVDNSDFPIATDMAIKALEQEPRYIVKSNASAEDLEKLIKSIDSPIVAPYPVTITPIYADVLDKIRAEIAELPKAYPFVNHLDTYVKEDDVLQIIDKYKAESEEEE